MNDLVVFLGPSLPAAEARRLAPCRVLPPARQGDLWRALALRPRAVALVDGVFESVPSVWHHEVLAALDAGVAVFGGASMGALRAAELSREGMVGVGTVFGWYRDGVVRDDAEVALIHAGPEHGFRAFSLPLVNVRHAAGLARAAGVLSRREAALLVEEATAIFYQERTWGAVLSRARPRWRPAAARRWDAWAANGIEDLKARDARETILAAAAYLREQRPLPGPPPLRGRGSARGGRGAREVGPAPSTGRGSSQEPGPALARAPRPVSSLVRRRRLREGATLPWGGEAPLSSGAVLAALEAHPDAAALAARGVERALLAALARAAGLRATPEARARAERAWLDAVGVRPRDRAAFLAASGLDDGEAARLCDDLALCEAARELSERLVADGPDRAEGLALEARLTGLWAEAAARLAERPVPGAAGRSRTTPPRRPRRAAKRPRRRAPKPAPPRSR
ncbi:TfuA-like protein [Anaeromyxobacter paludicola]|uniref:TfuA-like core domain-containing protein n=1 Tax=Anaeromyxobacter paludicola TaxID=2918171 RepID=A0ABN6NBP9_9BACT|nr:TfuA-like protein [Anaeromyxobacter paludicola]BDG10654.1 hypothetical protein AMPC_37670 [Anaeromyxobacter paludicola]